MWASVTATPTPTPTSTPTRAPTPTSRPPEPPTRPRTLSSTPTPAPTPTSTPTPTPTPPSGSGGVQINAGGSAVGSFIADTDYSGGGVGASTTSAIDTSGVSNPAPQAVYQTNRVGPSFSYTIPNLTP